MKNRLRAYQTGLAIAIFLVCLLVFNPLGLSPHPLFSSSSSDQLQISDRQLHRPTKNLTARYLKCDWDSVAASISQTAPSAQTLCQKRVHEGEQLVCMMNQEDPKMWASKYQSCGDLDAWGWYEEAVPTYNIHFLRLDDTFDKLGLDVNSRNWINSDVEHIRGTTTVGPNGGKVYRATHAGYENLFNLQEGVLLGYENTGPAAKNDDRKYMGQPPIDPLPELKQWSDVFFLSVLGYAMNRGELEQLKKLKHVFRHQIINDETRDTLRMIVGLEELDGSHAYPGFEYPIKSPQAKAAIATPNGRGVAWLLGQHKSVLGTKIIDRVNIFSCTDEGYSWCMYFRLHDGKLDSLQV